MILSYFYCCENSFPCSKESPFKISMISYLSLYVFYLKMSLKNQIFIYENAHRRLLLRKEAAQILVEQLLELE